MSEDVPLGLLFGLLIVLLLLSAFFSSTETALMSLNRYRLRHRARSGNHAARLTEKLLQRPERLIGLILLGNNAVNLAAAALVTVIAIRLGGEAAIFVATLILTVVVLIFAEVTPKTIAARYPSKIALPAALIYYPLLKIAYPLVWVISFLAGGLLWLIGIRGDRDYNDALSEAELRTLVAEAGSMMPRRHKRMLLSILDLGEITVDDVMVPRQEIVGIDLDETWEDNLGLIRKSRYSRLPVYRGDIENIVGVVHLRSILPDLAQGKLNQELLLANTEEPYFVPEGTPLNKQLVNFERLKQRFAFAVDEYGDVQGLVTTEDVLREIVGEFDTEPGSIGPEVKQEQDNVFVVDASVNIRQLNRLMTWDLPTDGPKTLNGLIVEQLETIPDSGAKLTLAGYQLEILETSEHAIKRVRITVPKRPAVEPRLSAIG
ncbi:MAG TPA: HlyC/CorC family transporter [Gammaproteobacteria bacterium]